MDFEWDEAKSERNRAGRGLPFELAIGLFDGPVLERADDRRDYRETRVQAVGSVAGKVLFCVYTDRDQVRRIVSLRYASRKERDAYRAAQRL